MFVKKNLTENNISTKFLFEEKIMLLNKNQEDFDEKFETLGLDENVLRAIKRLKFKDPTEIQKKAIPLIMTGKKTPN